jgi:hypothetical protein
MIIKKYALTLLTSSGKKRGGERKKRRDKRRKRRNIMEEERKREIFLDTGYMRGVYHHKLDKKKEKTERKERVIKRCLAHQPRTEIEYT